MTKDEYLTTRVDEQIKWYDKKSIQAKKNYTRATYIIMVCSVIIPVIANITKIEPLYKIMASVISGIIILSQSYINFTDYNETWIEYRKVNELLKREKMLFLTNANQYDTDDPGISFATFVENIENIISQENKNWVTIKKSSQEDK